MIKKLPEYFKEIKRVIPAKEDFSRSQ